MGWVEGDGWFTVGKDAVISVTFDRPAVRCGAVRRDATCSMLQSIYIVMSLMCEHPLITRPPSLQFQLHQIIIGLLKQKHVSTRRTNDEPVMVEGARSFATTATRCHLLARACFGSCCRPESVSLSHLPCAASAASFTQTPLEPLITPGPHLKTHPITRKPRNRQFIKAEFIAK